MRGGVSAVIWTDVVQMFVYVAGALVVFYVAAAADRRRLGRGRVGRRRGGQVPRLRFRASTPTRVYTFWSGLLGGVALTLATHGTDQFLVQRLLSARSARARRAGSSLSGFIVFAQFMLFLVIGVMLYAFYQQTPLPRAARHATTRSCRSSSSLAVARRRRLHRRRDRRRGALAVDQRDGRDDGQRLLSEVRPARRR